MIFPRPLTASELLSLSRTPELVELDRSVKPAFDAVHTSLKKRLENGESLYGINTGFGPLVHNDVDKDAVHALQQNLVHQLSVHAGPVLPWRYANAVTILRLNALSKGVSGVRFELLESLASLLKTKTAVKFPRWGSVGASGDLVPLSALAGTISGRNSTGLNDANQEIPLTGFSPLSFEPKEALALVNGTSFSCAITALETEQFSRFFDEILVPATLVFMFYMDSSFQHLSAELYAHKNHAAVLDLNKSVKNWLGTFNPSETPGTPQPPYSSRTAMLWLGTALERLQHAQKMIATELNSVDDNPLFINEKVLHGGNFQGTFVAYVADETTQSILLTTQILERQLNRMFHPAHNGGRAPFLAPEPAGLNSGLQGIQLAATSLLGEIRSKAISHTALSYPTNNDNQDIVSMSAHAANDLMDIGARFRVFASCYLTGLFRLVQVSAPVQLPEPLQNWLSKFDRFTKLDHKTVRYETVLADIEKVAFPH